MEREDSKNIFVIYTTMDPRVNKKLLLKICNDLQQYGNVFIDIIHNNSEDKQEYVIQMLSNSTHVVIVDSPEIKKSKWAQLELKIAAELKKEILGHYSIKMYHGKTLIEFESKHN